MRFWGPSLVRSLLLGSLLSSGGCIATTERVDLATLQREVMATERAFARTMAERNHGAFVSFLADEAIFFNGETPIRGKGAVSNAWRAFYDGPAAPFSWEPETVHVLDSGKLALSTGPVRGPDGQLVARFNSVWRREPSGQWRIVFDKGSPVCSCATPPP